MGSEIFAKFRALPLSVSLCLSLCLSVSILPPFYRSLYPLLHTPLPAGTQSERHQCDDDGVSRVRRDPVLHRRDGVFQGAEPALVQVCAGPRRRAIQHSLRLDHIYLYAGGWQTLHVRRRSSVGGAGNLAGASKDAREYRKQDKEGREGRAVGVGHVAAFFSP